MNAYVYISIFAGIFFILTNYWRSKNSTIFLILCAGNILSASTSGAVSKFLSVLVNDDSFPLSITVKASLLLLPAVLVGIITRGKSKKKYLIFNLIFGGLNSVLAYLWFIRTLSYEQFSALESMKITSQLLNIRDYLIGGGVLFSIIFVMFDSRKSKDKHDKHKKSH
jgi:hypothetical protein